MRTVFGRLMDKLAKRGLLIARRRQLHPDGGLHRSGGFGAGQAPRTSSPGIPGICRKACSAPRLARNSARSSAAKRTPCKSSSAAPNADLLDHFYGDGLFSSHWMASIGQRRAGSRPPPAGRPWAADSRSRRRHRRTGGAIAAAARSRPPPPTPSPTFPPASSPAANQKLAAFPEVEYKVLDLEKPSADQDFEPGSL